MVSWIGGAPAGSEQRSSPGRSAPASEERPAAGSAGTTSRRTGCRTDSSPRRQRRSRRGAARGWCRCARRTDAATGSELRHYQRRLRLDQPTWISRSVAQHVTPGVERLQVAVPGAPRRAIERRVDGRDDEHARKQSATSHAELPQCVRFGRSASITPTRRRAGPVARGSAGRATASDSHSPVRRKRHRPPAEHADERGEPAGRHRHVAHRPHQHVDEGGTDREQQRRGRGRATACPEASQSIRETDAERRRTVGRS